MKLLLFLLCIPFAVTAQKKSMYLQMGPSVNNSKKGVLVGGALGAGLYSKNAGAGFGLDIYQLDGRTFIPLYADFKYFVRNKNTKIFVTLQPGYHFSNKTTYFNSGGKIEERGGVFAASGAGLLKSIHKINIGIQLRYLLFATKTNFYFYNSSFKNESTGYAGINIFVQFNRAVAAKQPNGKE